MKKRWLQTDLRRFEVNALIETENLAVFWHEPYHQLILEYKDRDESYIPIESLEEHIELLKMAVGKLKERENDIVEGDCCVCGLHFTSTKQSYPLGKAALDKCPSCFAYGQRIVRDAIRNGH